MSSARYRKPYPASPTPTLRSSHPDTPTRDESYADEVGEHPFLGVLRNMILILVINFLLSYYITSTFFWNYDFQSSPLFTSTFFTFEFPRNFSDTTLALYNGSDPALPIYVGLNGSVYDVTENSRTYGPGGPYNHFAGRDAARAFVTGCFTTDLTHDLRGLDPVAAESDIAGWKAFFEGSTRYWYVGEVIHELITGPPPGECQAPKRYGN
ncbi:hypothetical protein LIPSTDRAFT_58042 [Lipomyces starkeyi NRRL Y-11557]|uniref:Cytochrome b5 heme-binding domain-containing protein n=1 Tax=Lipomyces starkeyi NRRL Y-11557 TaxID=675824 RepID=A0A1E3PXZ4_LIPST|nr:hypothetical protein LIPSTDRAFT_58042 [Lipomyces starkeyi NRRL Y-11557]